ncbi:ABC transporter substrate-binding protein [Kitasatospora viridis]|uniref:Peptide/nickel transport system substrate-binding protein n=1 Tax=Kitasatospora viridis TaxID=281105 RepID=A0A561T634_9ACTN|nr:ABC transporter substrate-binding protein [Kitasatospora viridis]TWF82572.1 peptide/nickel transport system substrate-binding protein [Kitasatospora viridis]
MTAPRISRRTLLRTVGAGLGAAAGAGLLAACGSGAAHPAALDADAPTASVAPKRGGKLRAAFAGSSAESTNVLQATGSAVDYVRARLIWDTLGELDGSKVIWRLAESVEPNADASRWTVKLRAGVSFSDGRQLTAQDVLFSLRTLAANPTVQAGVLGGLDPNASAVRDPRTLDLQLKAPDGFFDLVLAQSMFVFPDGTSDFAHALGSGPFLLKSWSAGASSLLTARTDYWDAANGGPYLDRIELFSVADAGARLNGLKAGQFDYAGGLTLATARAEQDNKALRVLTAPKELWSDLAFTMNLGTDPFTKPEAVQALKLAIDRDAMVRTVTLGYGEVAGDALGKYQTWYDTTLPARPHDPDQARRLLPGGKLSLRTSDYEYGTLESASAFVQQAQAAGIQVAVDKVPAADYYADVKTLLSTPLQTNLYHAQPLPLQLSMYYGPQAMYPFTGPADPTLTGLLAAMHTAVGDDRRTSAVHDVQHYLYDHGGDAVFARIPPLAASTPAVHGIQPRGVFDYPCLRDAFLA